MQTHNWNAWPRIQRSWGSGTSCKRRRRFLDRPRFREAWRIWSGTGSPTTSSIRAATARGRGLRRAFPASRLLDHLGKPDIRGNGFSEWRRHFDALAALPNSLQVSGLVTEADWRNVDARPLRPYLDAALDAFGTRA